MMSTYPSTCSECGEFLNIRSTNPGNPNAVVVVSCPNCEFKQEFEEEPR